MTATALCGPLSSVLVISHIKLCLIIIVRRSWVGVRSLESFMASHAFPKRLNPHQSDIVSQHILPLDENEIETSDSHMAYVGCNLILHPMLMLNVK